MNNKFEEPLSVRLGKYIVSCGDLISQDVTITNCQFINLNKANGTFSICELDDSNDIEVLIDNVRIMPIDYLCVKKYNRFTKWILCKFFGAI